MFDANLKILPIYSLESGFSACFGISPQPDDSFPSSKSSNRCPVSMSPLNMQVVPSQGKSKIEYF